MTLIITPTGIATSQLDAPLSTAGVSVLFRAMIHFN